MSDTGGKAPPSPVALPLLLKAARGLRRSLAAHPLSLLTDSDGAHSSGSISAVLDSDGWSVDEAGSCTLSPTRHHPGLNGKDESASGGGFFLSPSACTHNPPSDALRETSSTE